MGGEVATWRVGRAFAAPRLRELNGIYGGELAGHYYFRDFFYSDSGIMAALIILAVISGMKSKGVSLSALISGIERYQNSGEINFRIENKQKAMDVVRDYFVSEEKPLASYDFDGYRVEFNDWWFNVRPSNTEPYLRFIAEATTREVLDSKVSKVKELLSLL
jgi:phosphomannomutase